MAKTFLFKVFDSSGANIITTWNDVSNDPTYTQDLNTAGSQIDLILARDPTNFDEGVSVKHLNQVQALVVDNEAPNGVVIFTGFISTYAPDFAQNQVTVTLLSYGTELDNYMIEAATPTLPFYSVSPSFLFAPPAADSLIGFGGTLSGSFPPGIGYAGDSSDLAQSFVAEGTAITKVRATIFPYNAGFSGTVECQIWTSVAGLPGVRISTGTITAPVSDTTNQTCLFDFSSVPVAVTSSQVYFIVLTAPSYGDLLAFGVNEANAAAGGTDPRLKLFAGSVQASASWTQKYFNSSYKNVILQFSIYNDRPDTTVGYYTQDPGAIFRALMDKLIAAGSHLSYTTGTIELTGTLVSYVFNTNSFLDGAKKCVELAPAGWYWYVDQATNLVHFHKRATTADISFTLGRDILSLVPEKRLEPIINTVYFTGGAVEGVTLFKKYVNTGSVALYGRWQQKYTDSRVTIEATADTIANTLMNNHATPEIRTTIDIVDSNGSPGGYDIESIKLGQVVGFNGFGGTAPPLWDQAQWDTAVWDFNNLLIGTLAIQITRLIYLPDKITLTLSTVPPDVNKRIEDINRALEAQQTAANPSQPG